MSTRYVFPGMRPMNILFFADPNSIHDFKWINYFTSQGAVNAFLLPRDHHWAIHPEKSDASWTRMLLPIPDFSMVRFYRTLVVCLRIRQIIKQQKIDLVNIHYAEPNALWCIFRWFFGVPMIITTLGTDVLVTIPNTFKSKTLINRLVAPAYRLAFRNADWITGTSERQLQSVMRFSGRSDRMTIIRTGVDLNRLYSDTSSFFPLDDDSPYILFPRYIKPIYNHLFSLAAIGELPNRIKTKYKMVFVGRDHGDATYQRELEGQMKQQSDIRFEFIGTQSQESIIELYKRASAVVMTPSSDGSPVSGMEALLCGAKLILGPLNYDADIFSQAIRMRTWDADELAALITQALDDPGRPQLSAETIAAMDRETNMQKMMRIYESVIEAKGL